MEAGGKAGNAQRTSAPNPGPGCLANPEVHARRDACAMQLASVALCYRTASAGPSRTGHGAHAPVISGMMTLPTPEMRQPRGHIESGPPGPRSVWAPRVCGATVHHGPHHQVRGWTQPTAAALGRPRSIPCRLFRSLSAPLLQATMPSCTRPPTPLSPSSHPSPAPPRRLPPVLPTQIKTCDSILSGMEMLLAKFQSELGKVRPQGLS